MTVEQIRRLAEKAGVMIEVRRIGRYITYTVPAPTGHVWRASWTPELRGAWDVRRGERWADLRRAALAGHIESGTMPAPS
jgi:hypothetical protein